MKSVEYAIRNYLRARNHLLRVAQEHPHLLAGNDNIIGRIGEFIAISHLAKWGRTATKAESATQKGHDLLADGARISVKILTSENTFGRGVRLTDPWDELILIEFHTTSLEYRAGHLLRPNFEQAVLERGWSRRPYVKRTMLGSRGLIGLYGVVENGKFGVRP